VKSEQCGQSANFWQGGSADRQQQPNIAIIYFIKRNNSRFVPSVTNANRCPQRAIFLQSHQLNTKGHTDGAFISVFRNRVTEGFVEK
jgi:hypothetical protein